MGCCLSCLEMTTTASGSSESEVQMSSKAETAGSLSKSMSSPDVRISGEKSNTVTGHGLALVNVVVEQDAAYWEWHVEKTSTDDDENDAIVGEEELEGENDQGAIEDEDDGFEEVVGDVVKFGVSTKKKPAFYKKLAKARKEAAKKGDDENVAGKVDDGTTLMRGVPNLKDGDTVGVAVQQSDLPMVQFLINGEPIHNLAINRWRGTVYPSIWFSERGHGGGRYKATLVTEEDKFRQLAPHARFGPLIAARGII